MTRSTRLLLLGAFVIVLLLVIVPSNSEAQTAGTLQLGPVTHNADGTATAELTATPAELASLAVTIDGEPVTFQVADAGSQPAARVVFAVENSVSMTFDQLAQLQAELREFAANLEAGDQIGIVTYGGGTSVALPLTTDRAAFEDAVGALTVDGGSALYSGVTAAAEELGSGTGPALLVVVTYGWEWGGLSTDTRDASIAAVEDSGATVYVQSMLFDGSADLGYLTPLASDGVVHNIFDLPALSDTTAQLGSAVPARTLTIDAPALASGEHELRVATDDAEQVATFEVTNAGLIDLVVETPSGDADPIVVRLDSSRSLAGYDLSAALGGASVDITGTSISLDPYAFEAGTATLDLSATVDGAPAFSTSQPINIPALEPSLTVDRSDERSLTATVLAQPGQIQSLVAVVDGTVVDRATTGMLVVDRPESGDLTFEARDASGAAVLSERVSATAVVEFTDETPAEDAGGSPFWASPTFLAIPLVLVALVLLFRRRGLPRRAGGAASQRQEWTKPEPRREQPVETPAAHVEPALAPVPLPIQPDAQESEIAAPVEDSPAEPIPLHPVEWAVVVRTPDGHTHRTDLGLEPISIGASKLCTITLEGDAVRFVHLVIARDGKDLKAHQFGPVTVNGAERDVEDPELLATSVMQVGEVSIWLEEAAQVEVAAIDAA